MILTCPSCGARYLIASDTIGEAGRPVRCAKCKTEWHQQSEKDSLDDLIKRVKSETVDIDFGETSAWNSSPRTAPPPPVPQGPSKLRVFLEGSFAKVKDSKVYKKLANLDPALAQKIAGGMVALACFMVLVFVLILEPVRQPIAEHLPVMAPIYNAAGFPVEVLEKEKLVFDRLRAAEGDGGKIRISGTLINLLAIEAHLRPFQVKFLDEQGQILLEKEIEMTQKTLKGEDSVQIYFDVDVTPEAQKRATHIKLSLMPLTEEHAKKED
jgi:predicted Zn finger-like uncharacterized protein